MTLIQLSKCFPVLQRNLRVTYSTSTWKNFTLEDELTLEVKQSIEKKWSKYVYGVQCPAELSKSIKPVQESSKYILSMFPYPSGKLHLGHVRVYTLSDVIARFYRLRGYNVIHPMGWDAFGLPAENAARDHNIEPEKWTRDNIEFMRNQILSIGCCFDWNRELATCDPSYYKWTQWLFVKLWESGLVYKKRAYVFWDPIDQTVLAEEQVDSEMRSWRSGAKVEKKLLAQWFVKTSVFAEELMKELNSGKLKHGWRDIIDMQKHWIGSIKGRVFETMIPIKKILNDDNDKDNAAGSEPLRVWFSEESKLKEARFCILQPTHFLADSPDAIAKVLENGIKVLKFTIKNPLTGADLPVITGPADIMPLVPESSECRINEVLNEEEYQELAANEGVLNELEKLQLEVSDSIPSENETSFKHYPASLKLRDWLVSRQRKWGTPIPVSNCSSCGHSSIVPPELLPVGLSTKLLDPCSKCGSENLELETDTLDTFFDSSWYFLRYLDSTNGLKIFDKRKAQEHLPVDVYVGGKEHATLHLYYARFMSHFIHSLGLIPIREPFQKLIPVGIVQAQAYRSQNSGKYLKPEEITKDDTNVVIEKSTGEPVVTEWEKMSKSKYNGIDPAIVLGEFGIDTTRLLSVSEATPTSPRHWPPNNLTGFLNTQARMWHLMRNFVDEKDFGEILFADEEEWAASESKIFDARNFYLKGVIHDYSDTSQISVVVSKLQGLLGQLRTVPAKYYKDSVEFERALGALVIAIYPILPAFSAQLWQSFRAVATHTELEFNLDKEVWEQSFPDVDQSYQLDLICMVNGEEIIVKVERQYLDGMNEDTAFEIAFEDENIATRVNRDNTQVKNYSVEPGFRATLHLYDPTSKVLTSKEKKKKKKLAKKKNANDEQKIEAESKV